MGESNFDNKIVVITNQELYPLSKDLNWLYIRRSKDVQGVAWASYKNPIYVLCPEGYRVWSNQNKWSRPALIFNLLKTF